MTDFICVRCLSRPLPQLNRTRTRATKAFYTFSTTSPAQKGKGVLGAPSKPSWQTKGPVAPKTSRKTAPGERKAFRKRVVLSNVNAHRVEGLPTLGKHGLETGQPGQIVALSDELIDAIRANEAFKPTQRWHMFHQPATLVRGDTLRMMEILAEARNSTGNPVARRCIVVGPRGCGKSVLLLQTMATALIRGWVVIHIPDPNALTNGSTSYAPDSESTTDRDGLATSYIQPHATAALLSSIAKANSSILSTLQLSQDHSDLPIPLQSNMTLDRLAQLGANDPQLSWTIYKSLWKELVAPGRPTILFTVDGVSHFMTETGYTSPHPDMKPLHAFDFRLVQHAMDLLTGQTALPNGGAVLFEDSTSNRPGNEVLDFIIRREEAIAALASRRGEGLRAVTYGDSVDRAVHGVDKNGVPVFDRHVARDQRAMECFGFSHPQEATEEKTTHENPPGQKQEPTADSQTRRTRGKMAPRPPPTPVKVEVLRIGGLSRQEAKACLEYYAHSGLLKANTVDGPLLDEKWTVSGGGIVGELEKACLSRA